MAYNIMNLFVKQKQIISFQQIISFRTLLEESDVYKALNIIYWKTVWQVLLDIVQ